jgi:hypothetical protein
MAITGSQKRTREDQDGEPASKRQEVQLHPEDEVDEAEDDDFSDDSIDLNITMDSFKEGPSPVDISEGDFAKFLQAFEEVQEEWLSEDNVLVLGNPTHVRPVPLTAEEFKTRMPIFKLDEFGMQNRDEFQMSLEEAMFADDEEQEDDEDKATDNGEEAEAALDAKADKEVLAVFQNFLVKAEGSFKAARLSEALQLVAVITHCLLDAELSGICEVPDLAKEFTTFLKGIEKVWQGLFKKSDADLKIDAVNRRGAQELVKLIRTAVNDDSFLDGSLKGSFEVA